MFKWFLALVFLLCLPWVASADQYLHKGDVVIVVDPGHGGKDPGTTGPNGTHEKNVVLAISQWIRHDINKTPGFHAILTRNGDYFIPLVQRMQIAQHDHANFFVAIHADAFYDKTAKGASVFALSLHGATGEAARWIARRENESEMLGEINLHYKSPTLSSILISLSQTASIRTSLAIGKVLLNHIGKISALHHGHRVQQANFVVLKSPYIPSLLIETGFLSNLSEEKKLDNPLFRKKMGQAIASGIIDYFEHHPLHG